MRLVKDPPPLPLDFLGRAEPPPSTGPAASFAIPRGPVMAYTTPPNMTMKPMTDRIGKPPIMVALNATPHTSIASPITKSATPWRRRRADGARRFPPRTLEANFGSSA